jgi:hypothetical protein
MADRTQRREWCVAGGVLLWVLVALHSGFAQQTQQSSSSPSVLDEILKRLDGNLNVYYTSVPSFFCDEHVVSLRVYGYSRESRVTDSTFRLKRTPHDLVETRMVKSINGKPAEGENLYGPAVVAGVFSGGLDTVSLGQSSCMSYTLDPAARSKPDDPYVVDFASRDDGSHAGCVLHEESSGRVLVDPFSMQVMRMELTAPHHTIIPANRLDDGFLIPPVIGVWKIRIDYSPVKMEGKTFWLPATIVSTATSSGDENVVWSFDAKYGNYHKLEVKSRIVPGSETAQSEPK